VSVLKTKKLWERCNESEKCSKKNGPNGCGKALNDRTRGRVSNSVHPRSENGCERVRQLPKIDLRKTKNPNHSELKIDEIDEICELKIDEISELKIDEISELKIDEICELKIDEISELKIDEISELKNRVGEISELKNRVGEISEMKKSEGEISEIKKVRAKLAK